MALESIQSSIDGIAHHTDDAAAASREAARADLESLLERASVRASKWTPRSAVQATALPAHGPLTDWIAALLRGADPRTAAPVDGDDGVRLVVGAVRALLELVNAEARAILGDLIQAAVAVSRNGYAWNSIGGSLDAVSEEITIVRATVDESAKAAQASAELAGQVRSLVDTIRTRYAAALALLDGALGRIAGITSSVGEIDAFVESMGTAAARADEIMGLIETLSAETDLLSLNAAIEAAHAGELGLGFGVIAEEIGALARSTNESTSSVSQLVSNVSRISSDLQRSIGAAAASMDGVGSDAAGVRGAIETLRTSFEAAIDRAHDVSGTAETQQSALGRVRDDVQRSSAAAEENARAVTDDRRIELSMLGSRAHAVAARRPLGTVVERVRALSESLSMGIEDALASALRSGRVSPERLFELRYTPIAGEEIASLARLFDISRVPAGGFSPPKYAAPWDACVDEALIDVLSTGWDEALAAGISPVAMFVSDLNGFFYAYPRQKIGPWTNDPASDGLGNRIKRIFDDDYSLRVVRAGLGPHAHGLGKRLPYEAFRTAGCELERTAERPWSASVYARDTNAVCNEVCSALFVNGRRHGALRVCYEPNLV
jgi:methyl-accepting chemotaxis protein